MEHKSEKNGKVSIFLAGTVPDGVTKAVTYVGDGPETS
jgi:hypothetical protein